MSGGIFPKYPFVLNIKCIIFSIIIMIIYSFCPPNFDSKIVIFLIYFSIFVISYVSLAWYDYYYSCSQLPLFRGKYSITGLAKPPLHEPTKQSEHLMSEIEIDKNNTMIYWLHILIIVPLISYIGIMKDKAHTRTFDILVVLGVFTAIYHGSKLLVSSHNIK
jgi:hypothetical protein